MGTATLARREDPANLTRPANGKPATGLFVGALDRELAELERRGLARLDPAGTVAITRRGLEELNVRFPRRRR